MTTAKNEANHRALRACERAELDDLRPDYRTGPLEDVVAGIRKVLGAEPPEDDPFAPPMRAAPVAKPPATVKLPEKPAKSESETVPAQKALALKAATRAIQATGGNGFRIPAAKPGKSRRPKHRHGRGPPR